MIHSNDHETSSLSDTDNPITGKKKREPKQNKLILCFDGTGNQYSGDTSDTNIVKLYQKFDREALNQFHYYQRKSSM